MVNVLTHPYPIHKLKPFVFFLLIKQGISMVEIVLPHFYAMWSNMERNHMLLLGEFGYLFDNTHTYIIECVDLSQIFCFI